ncbi:MAG TPA: hypothetical protein PKZ84_00065 [Anaerolineae bacterium]|nr:hypothetical protein [Anaerolineae bacterium]HQI83306.1 hypothetical protein [Anaerolineae bacterium]
MNERVLRWKGRIGSLKVGCGFILVFAVIIACAGVASLSTALNNADTPQEVSIGQLVNGDIAAGRYVSVSGLAVYDIGYEKSEDGKPTATYYFVINPNTGDMVLVKHTSALVVGLKNDQATVTGMTRAMPSDLKDAVKEDETLFTQNDVRTTTALYIEDGAKPPTKGSSIMMLAVGLIGAGLCCIPFFFPGVVFAPTPLDVTVAPATERYGVKATGTFTKLKSVEPLEVGKATRKFTNAVANIIPLGEHELMIYIHHILKTKTYGITVNTTITDWGVFLRNDHITDVTAGKIFGWKDKWATRFQYAGPKDKTATLYVIFEEAGAQAAFVKLLRAMQFSVVTGDMAA